jgi:hypothetical protein
MENVEGAYFYTKRYPGYGCSDERTHIFCGRAGSEYCGSRAIPKMRALPMVNTSKCVTETESRLEQDWIKVGIADRLILKLKLRMLIALVLQTRRGILICP